MKKKYSLLLFMLFALFSGLFFHNYPLKAEAKVIEEDITPKEPASSDLKVVRKVTKLAARRWIQSYTMDSKYYYYIQMTSAYKGNLRITRVKYKGIGKYIKDHMDLRGFGHATNIDCSVSNGVTWLWTGSDCKGNDVSRTISGFRYQKNKILRKHGSIRYKIPDKVSGKYMTNVYPAINQNSTRMAVRYTYGGKQYYQIYNLVNGRFINPRNPIKRICLSATSGDFQGFDLYGSSIYTIEGSPRASFLRGYDRTRRYQPTKIRRYDYATGRSKKVTIKGAKTLSFREPEGIKILSGRRIYIMYVSNTLTDQSCNIYRVKKSI